jgi:hypothetical protein
MKSPFYFMILVGVLGLFVLSCDQSPNAMQVPLSDHSGVNSLAKASTFTSNVSFPIDLLFLVPCAAGGAGENVHVTGEIHDLFHTTLDGRGGFHLEFHQNAQGVRGIGLTTGDKYQVTGAAPLSFNGQVGFEQTFVSNLHFIGKGSASNFLLHQTLHITVNANGTVTAFFDNSRVECK